VPVSTALRRAQTLAFRLNHEPLKQWTRKELEGYPSIDELPDYRRFSLGALPVKGEFIDPTGIYSNVAIAPTQVPDYARERLFTPVFMQGVAGVEVLLATGLHEFPIPWTGDEVLLMRKRSAPWPDACSSDDVGQHDCWHASIRSVTGFSALALR